MNDPLRTVPNRIAGGLLGLAAGAAAADSRTGGEVVRWGSGEARLAISLARTYAEGYSLSSAADAFLVSLDTSASNLGPTTRSALARYRRTRDARRCALGEVGTEVGDSAPLARCLAIGLVRPGSAQRAAEAAEVLAITSPDRRCSDGVVVYCDLVAALLAEATPAAAVAEVLGRVSATEVRSVLAWAPRLPASRLRPTGDVLNALAAAVWALFQPGSGEEVLEELLRLGGDGQALAAAGGLLGAARGLGSIPERVARSLEASGAALA